MAIETALLAIQAAQAAYGLGKMLFSKDETAEERRRYGGSAKQFEDALSKNVATRLQGGQDPLVRSLIARATEREQGRQEATLRQFNRDAARRGLSGSGLLEGARARLQEQTSRVGAANIAQTETAAMANTEAQAFNLARYFRQQEATLGAMAMAKRNAYVGMVQSSLASLGSMYAMNKMFPEAAPGAGGVVEPEWNPVLRNRAIENARNGIVNDEDLLNDSLFAALGGQFEMGPVKPETTWDFEVPDFDPTPYLRNSAPRELRYEL